MVTLLAKTCRVAVIGAGPAGLIAAEMLAKAGHAVTVFDRMMSPARKFLMAGRGGLNLTHSEPFDTFIARYSSTAPQALVDAIGAFSPEMLVAWANELGQETFIGSSGRVFPVAMKASPLLRAWLRRLDSLGVKFELGQRWAGWTPDRGLSFTANDGTRQSYQADAVVLAMGGASWPRLGSDGGWVSVLRSAGVTVSDLAPSNAGVRIAWSDVMRRFAGQPLKRIAVTLGHETRRGEGMITDSGLEGGAIYAMSAPIRAALAAGHPAQLTIDLRPGDTLEILTRALSKPRGKQSMATFLKKTALLTPAAVSLLRESGKGAVPSGPDELARLIKAVPVTVTSFAGLERAISSAGGIPFTELDERLMLKSVPGMFAAGEMLDWDAPTGGYLLQACFATGVAAAKGVQTWLDENAPQGAGRPAVVSAPPN